MDWMKIGAALLLIMMLVYLVPRAMHAVKHSEKGSNSDWLGFALVLGGVGLFVALLDAMV